MRFPAIAHGQRPRWLGRERTHRRARWSALTATRWFWSPGNPDAASRLRGLGSIRSTCPLKLAKNLKRRVRFHLDGLGRGLGRRARAWSEGARRSQCGSARRIFSDACAREPASPPSLPVAARTNARDVPRLPPMAATIGICRCVAALLRLGVRAFRGGPIPRLRISSHAPDRSRPPAPRLRSRR